MRYWRQRKVKLFWWYAAAGNHPGEATTVCIAALKDAIGTASVSFAEV